MFLKQKISIALIAFIAAGSAAASAEQVNTYNDTDVKSNRIYYFEVKPVFVASIKPAVVNKTATRAAIATTTTTIPSVPNGLLCPEYYNLAKEVGWPEDQLERLDYVMWRESRCDPSVHNKKDPAGGSRGLIQINGFWCRPNRFTDHGFLQDNDVLVNCDQLFDPHINLSAGLAIYNYGLEEHGCGWGPWSTKKSRWC